MYVYIYVQIQKEHIPIYMPKEHLLIYIYIIYVDPNICIIYIYVCIYLCTDTKRAHSNIYA